MSHQADADLSPLAPDVRDQLSQVTTATMTGGLLKRGFRTRFMLGVVPLRPDLKLVGVARTLRYVPMREDLGRVEPFRSAVSQQRLAVEQVGPGEVLVIDARGERTAGTMGDILMTRVQVRGAAGVVTDGCFRDTDAISAIDLPTYCAGAHAYASPVSHYPVDIDRPIACGGVMVLPGDVLVGDRDGVVVIPRYLAAELAAEAVEQEQQEAFVLERIRAGASVIGTYPMNEATMAEYQRWRESQQRGG
jgi:regulator of RNase E activity RraA